MTGFSLPKNGRKERSATLSIKAFLSFLPNALRGRIAVEHRGTLEKKVYRVPHAIDAEIARLKLASMGVSIDPLTEEQRKYLESWEMGT